MTPPIARMLASRLAWLSTTPFGSPVLPDVYWMSAVELGVVRSEADRPTPPDASTLATLSTALKVSTCARSKPASRRPSGTVISMRAPALRRMPAWRRR